MKGTKTGGRMQGTPNKVTLEMRERITEILQSELIHYPKLLKLVEPIERLQIGARLLSFILPRMQEIAKPDNEEEVSRAFIDYTALPPEILKLILNATTIDETTEL